MGHDRRAENLVAEIAADQHGVVSGVQLRWAGISRRTATRWVERARLFRTGWRVYAVVPRVGDLGLARAALLSAGADRHLLHGPPADGSALDLPRATYLERAFVLSHWSALRLQRITTGPAVPADVTIVGRRSRPRVTGVRGHQGLRLDAADVRIVEGLPTVTVARALIDVAPSTPAPRLRRLIREAQFLGLLPAAAFATTCARVPWHPGVAALRASDPDLATRLDGDSPLGGDLGVFLSHETALGPWVPQHRVVVPGGSYVLDFARPDLRLAAEADGAGAHEQSQGRTSDGRRDAVLLANDWLTVRVTDGRLKREPEDLRETIHAIAARRGWPGPPDGWRPRSAMRDGRAI